MDGRNRDKKSPADGIRVYFDKESFHHERGRLGGNEHYIPLSNHSG